MARNGCNCSHEMQNCAAPYTRQQPANDIAKQLWEMSDDEILGMPSRLTAEAPERNEREKFFRSVDFEKLRMRYVMPLCPVIHTHDIVIRFIHFIEITHQGDNTSHLPPLASYSATIVSQ